MSKKEQSGRETMTITSDDVGTVDASLRSMQTLGMVPDSQSFVEKVDPSWLEGIKIERIATLEPGDGIRGIFQGPGPTVEVSDPVTGETRDLGTWRIEVKPDVVCRLLTSSQLEREFRAIAVGRRVRVIKLGQVATRKGRRVNDFVVGVEPA